MSKKTLGARGQYRSAITAITFQGALGTIRNFRRGDAVLAGLLAAAACAGFGASCWHWPVDCSQWPPVGHPSTSSDLPSRLDFYQLSGLLGACKGACKSLKGIAT